MPRRARSYVKRVPKPDPRYSSTRYAKFINYLMERGKKSVAQTILYDALDIVTQKMANTPVGDDATGDKKILRGEQVFEQALRNVCPLIEVKGRRIGGSNYQVPMEVMEPRRTTLGMKWLIKAARSRKGAPMREKLAAEIIDAFNKLGAAYKKREDVHRMAESNKAFAHFARFGSKRK